MASKGLHFPALLDITARLAPCSPPSTSVQQAPGASAAGWSPRANVGPALEAGTAWLVWGLPLESASQGTTALKVVSGIVFNHTKQVKAYVTSVF